MLGILLATLAQLAGALGKILMKKAHTLSGWQARTCNLAAFVSIIILNPVCGLAAYAYAAQSLLAPLSVLNLVWNATVTLGGVAYGAQLAYSHSQQPNHTSSYLVVYANDDGNPQPASIGFLVYGGIPAPPPPPPPACITSYTKAACDSCAEACSWCASADGVHALCFDETDTPATGWSCD